VFAYFKRRQHEKATLETLYSVLSLYPHGPHRVLTDYQGIREAINDHYKNGLPAPKSAVIIARMVLADIFESLDPAERTMLKEQVAAINWGDFAEMIGEARSGRRPAFPHEVTRGALFVGVAIITAQEILNSGEIEPDDLKLFLSEVTGSLLGKSSEVRSSERLGVPVLDNMVLTLSVGDDDETRVLPSRRRELHPELSGFEAEVALVLGATGIALVRTDNGEQITQPHSLSQDDIAKIPRNFDSYHFVNLTTRGNGEICSCITAGPDNVVYGDRRAFWWALARENVATTTAKANGTPMTETAFARIRATGRGLWDEAIRRNSIDQMRDQLVPVRNTHFTMAQKLIETQPDEPGRLGLEIALAMILATQSEDEKLEKFAFEQFKRFLWQEGEGPQEFRMHA
jgi:hypothetical protein